MRPSPLHLHPWGAIYREEDVVIYIYSIGRVKFYKKALGFIKESFNLINRLLNAATKSLDLTN